jgi:non-ribosomal peptide synthetase component F
MQPFAVILLMLCRDGGGVDGSLGFATDLFDRATIQRMSDHLSHLLAAVSIDSDVPLSNLIIMGPSERRLVLHDFNDTTAPWPSNATLHERFERRAEQRPDAPCLISGDTCLSFGEVNSRANQLAHWLVSRGIAAGRNVAVSSHRCCELYIALIAVLKSGGAYVPLDPSLPAERAAFILRQTGVQLLLTSACNELAKLPSIEAVTIDQGWQQFEGQPTDNLPGRSGPTDLANITFTSGSTGVPKV